MPLIWTRTRDGEHNGKPCYEYSATGADGTRYSIVWAYDRGGSFGYTAYSPVGERLSPGVGIVWARRLGFCKDACEKIERTLRGRAPPLPKLIPNTAGQFDNFEDWCNRATRALANRTCDSSGCTVPVPAMCVDTKGRRCYQGGDFSRARDEGTFPVIYFWDLTPE